MIVIYWYAGVAAVVLVLSIIFYSFSVKSRKRYRCPECGEKLATEHMSASRCGMCGAEIVKE